MKNHHIIWVLNSGLILYLISFILQSCSPTNKIIIENDIVYASKRIELNYICKDNNRRSPLLYLEQTIIKEIKTSENESTVKVFDVLALSSSGFKLEEKAYIIVDNHVFQLTIDNIERELAKTITKKTEDILTADSTTVSVVTGYAENNKNITRFRYTLSEDIIKAIQTSNLVLFRYYAGPSMITVKLKHSNLAKLKRLIDSK